MSKKVFPFLTVSILIFSLFIGCDSQTNTSPSVSNTSKPEQIAPDWVIGVYYQEDGDKFFTIDKTSYMPAVWEGNDQYAPIVFGTTNEKGTRWDVVESTDTTFVCSYIEKDGSESPHLKLVKGEEKYEYYGWDFMTNLLEPTPEYLIRRDN